MSENEKTINAILTVAGRRIPIQVNGNEEYRLRKAAASVEDILTQYKERYRDNKQDEVTYLAMVALYFSNAYYKLLDTHDAEAFTQELSSIEREIKHYLGED